VDGVIVRLAALIATLLAGVVELRLLSRRDIPCVTWFMGLLALAVWIAGPFTRVRVIVAGGVVILGTFALHAFYRRRQSSAKHSRAE